MASASRTITIRFDGSAAGLRRAASQVSKALENTKDQAKKSGDSIGKGFSGSFGDALKASVPTFVKEFGTSITAGLKGALSTPVLGPVVIAAVAALATSMAAAIAAVISGGLVLGIGAAVVGLGVLFATHSSKGFKKGFVAAFKDTFKDITKIMKDASKPILPVLDTVRKVLKETAKEFGPVIKASLKIAQGPLKQFIEDLGDAFKEFADSGALESIMTAFGDILDSLGPQLPGLFKSIGKSMKQLGKTVSENSDVIAALFGLMLALIPPVIDILGGLTRFFTFSIEIMMDGLDKVSGMFAGFLKVLAHVPGMGWAKEAADQLDAMGNRFRAAKREIEENKIRAKLEGDIQDLDAKIATAKSKLKDPKLTKPEAAKIRADIKQLLAEKKRAQDAINSLRGGTVTIAIRPGNGEKIRNPGTIKGFRASGGPVGAGRTYLVGERGPELLTMAGRSGKITPNHKLVNGEAGGGGTTVNVNLRAYSEEFRLSQVMQDLYAMGVH